MAQVCLARSRRLLSEFGSLQRSDDKRENLRRLGQNWADKAYAPNTKFDSTILYAANLKKNSNKRENELQNTESN